MRCKSLDSIATTCDSRTAQNATPCEAVILVTKTDIHSVKLWTAARNKRAATIYGSTAFRAAGEHARSISQHII